MLGHPEFAENLLRYRSATRRELRPELQRVLDVSPHGHVLEQRVVLKHDAHAALIGLRMRDIATVEHDRARIGLQKPHEDAKRGGLAAARGAQNGQELPFSHLEVEVMQNDFAAEGLSGPARRACHQTRESPP